MGRFLTVAVAAVGLAVAQGAIAQDSDGRFSITPTPDGFLKLDRKTGVVSQCARQDSLFRCSVVPDERHALQDEIDRLSRDNAELRARLDAAATAGTGATKPPPLPSDAEFDRALSLMERALRRFKDMMREPAEGKPL